MNGVRLQRRFDRQLTAVELELLIAELPSQVHCVPGGVGAFGISAKTLEEAVAQGTVFADGLSAEIANELA